MSILGIADATVASLVRPLTDPQHDRDAVAERFARATWTAIVEPGDGVAGAVVAALGAEAALAALLDDRAGRLLLHALDEHGVELDPGELDDGIARWTPRISKSDALLALRQGARFALSLVVPGDPDWPAALDDLGVHAPLALWLRGDRSALGSLGRAVAIVGARAATGYGEHVTIELASGLADRGYAIVSGAAYGIDGAAHRAALASRADTVAFLAGGLDRFYPSGHEALLGRIVEHGAAISEVPCGVAPTKWRFLQRNRCIAAAGLATVVVEAGARSGSLNTAGHAAALGRPLGAVPGPVTSSASAGCHRLLREYDAVCVTTADEIAELAPLPEAAHPTVERADQEGIRPAADPTGTRIRLLDALAPRSPRTPEKIAALSGLAVDRVRAELGLLALDGAVRERGGGWVRAAP
ncbi:DNA-processing protein DprA [Protaetiibacter mangrovi]|uniref:DNA-processing protein DprA n=1 Tax=Protaetiibacter mangrovi TaxID=2970926 RepID=A0ABT1ZIE6_9MICO|nr:DNA-processing protein DprA [Protaetiibacter mangrovi]MCS0500466.1 DNA-processing protein DprA [Protaetiibacter mangrovi]TPX04592.1 DNA-protecting protein DprA [Schumannella luteola]